MLALYMNFAYTFCLSACRLSGDRHGSAWAALALFALFALIYIVGSAAWSIWRIWSTKYNHAGRQISNPAQVEVRDQPESKCDCGKCLLLLTQVLAGLCYYLGDNLPRLFLLYGTVLGCDKTCINNANAAGFILLAIGAVVYFPMTAKNITKKIETKEQKSSDKKSSDNGRNDGENDSHKVRNNGENDSHKIQNDGENDSDNDGENNKICDSTTLVVFMLLAMLTDFDLLYTVVNRIKSTKCPFPSYTHGTWAYWAIFSVLAFCAIFWIVGKHVYEQRSKEKDVGCINCNCNCCIPIFSGILIWMILASFLLADNELPLSCAVRNMTESIIIVEGNEKHEIKEARMALWALIMLLNFPILLIIVWGCYKYYSKKKRNYYELH